MAMAPLLVGPAVGHMMVKAASWFSQFGWLEWVAHQAGQRLHQEGLREEEPQEGGFGALDQGQWMGPG